MKYRFALLIIGASLVSLIVASQLFFTSEKKLKVEPTPSELLEAINAAFAVTPENARTMRMSTHREGDVFFFFENRVSCFADAAVKRRVISFDLCEHDFGKVLKVRDSRGIPTLRLSTGCDGGGLCGNRISNESIAAFEQDSQIVSFEPMLTPGRKVRQYVENCQSYENGEAYLGLANSFSITRTGADQAEADLRRLQKLVCNKD